MNNREKFIEIFNKYITREGSDKLLEYFFQNQAIFLPHQQVQEPMVHMKVDLYICQPKSGPRK